MCAWVLTKDEYTITMREDLCPILSRFVQASMHRDCIVSALSNRAKTVTFFFFSNHFTHRHYSLLTPPSIRLRLH